MRSSKGTTSILRSFIFYIDPPYWDYEDYYGKCLFGREDFTILAELLGRREGRFILPLNDKPDVRKMFSSFSFETADVPYTCSSGKNLVSPELLIRNFD